MKVKWWRAGAKAAACFFLLGFALPVLLDAKISVVWVLSSLGISLAITMAPEYTIAKLKRKRLNNQGVTESRGWLPNVLDLLNKKALRIVGETLFIFVLMAFIGPALQGKGIDTTWLIIAAIAAPVGAVIGDYLHEKQKARKRQDSRKKKGSKNT